MNAEVLVGYGNVSETWNKLIEKLSKDYTLTKDETKLLKNFDTISLTSELVEISYQRLNNMIGMVVAPVNINDFNPIKLYVITNDEKVIKSSMIGEEDIYYEFYNKFLSEFDENGLGIDLSINVIDRIEEFLWKYLEVFNYLNYSSIKYSKFDVEESQNTTNGRITLKKNSLFIITKSGTVHPLIEAMAFNSQNSIHDKSYL